MRRFEVTLLFAMFVPACTRAAPPGGPEAGAQGSSVHAAPATRDAQNAKEIDDEAARALRVALVHAIEARGYVTNERVLDAMRRVPRHLFVPDAPLGEAYGDWPLPIGDGQTISQPSLVGEMTDALELRGGERVLEIGTGSGYQAAILSLLAREVYTIEIVPALGERAEARLRTLGHANVHVRVGDGYAGWPEQAPFDRVILTAAPPEVPKALLDQLRDGGILIAPVGGQTETQWLVRIQKNGSTITRERLAPVRFVPMVPGRRGS